MQFPNLFLLLSLLVLSTNVPIPTPHISAKKGDFAETVLMPGDPKHSKFIADKNLENPVLVNDVRGVQGYTGNYKGKKSVTNGKWNGNACYWNLCL